MGPQLNASLCGELLDLENKIIKNSDLVEHWFRKMFLSNPPPFYSSVDLRNSCFKISPIDTNLFPAGFNNIGEKDRRCVVQALMAAIERNCSHVKKVILIPESHTRNKFYLAHLGHLFIMLSNAGLNVRIGSFDADFYNLKSIYFNSSDNLPAFFNVHQVKRQNDQLYISEEKDFIPDLILLNNDFSKGIPENLLNLNNQLVLPTLNSSWSSRRKSNHFKEFDEIAKEFSKIFKSDDWLIKPFTKSCSKVNFKTKEGESCLADYASDLIIKIKRKYKEYKIKKNPFIVLKADAGTYGMGVMTIRDPSEIFALNNRQRNKMSKAKEGVSINNVLVQEGVYSFETVVSSNLVSVAEPVVYLVDKYTVGGFYRIHSERGLDENLNSPGMQFYPLAFEESCQSPTSSLDPKSSTNRLYFYSVIARLASLSASKEIRKK